jgi:Cu+-exporting ATPase
MNATDLVCGMTVNTETARHRFQHAGSDYFFCSAGCRTKFTADPAKYLAPAPQVQAPPAQGGYTCPMHPDIHQPGPGSCPICGMALEPVQISAEAPENPELADMSHRFWVGLALALPVVVLDMTSLAPECISIWAQAVLATPVVLWAGLPFFQRGWASVRSLHLNMFTLIALGTCAAYGFSLAATVAPGIFPAGFRGASGAVPVYYEAAAVITVLVLLGQMLELRARDRTGGAIRALLNLAPKTARRLRDGGDDDDIPASEIRIGDRLRVRPGEAVPTDGTVLEGSSAVDESMVTGEAMPVEKSAGAKLIGGTLNGAGPLVLRAEAVGSDTVLAHIVGMVAAAQRSRAPIQRLADRVAAWFVPAVLAAAVCAFVAWAVWGPAPALGYALVAAVSVVVIACPCALGLATPMSIMVGVGAGARAGVLIKSAEALEQLERADTLVVDKTGTLTEGRPRLIALAAAPGHGDESVLRLAASLERGSEHPLAAAILSAAQERGLEALDATSVQSVTGQGMTGAVDGQAAALGNETLMRSAGADISAFSAQAETLRRDGATVLFAALGGSAAGLLALADPVKPSARAALDRLGRDGMRIVMLTGDNQTTAEAVARTLGITDIHAGILPDGKQRVVTGLRRAGKIVAMAGDGVNDAPALAAANIGIAMGTGTDIAMQSAGITLVKGDLAGIVRARALSRATMRNIRQNLFFAFAYNAVGIPIAAGALYPVFGLLLSPAIAALAMSLSSVCVIANALRLRSVRL